MEGGYLGVFCRRCVAGVLWWNFAWVGTGYELGSGHGGFLEKIGIDPSWVIWKNVWLKSIDGPWLGDLEGWLVRYF